MDNESQLLINFTLYINSYFVPGKYHLSFLRIKAFNLVIYHLRVSGRLFTRAICHKLLGRYSYRLYIVNDIGAWHPFDTILSGKGAEVVWII